MKPAILKREVRLKGFLFAKGAKVFIAQKNENTSLIRTDKDSSLEYLVPNEALKLVSNDVKVKIHVKRLPRRNEAMFYFRQHIATITKGHRNIFVESAGEMKAYFTENGDCYHNDMLAKELRSRKTTDRGLSTLGSNDQILMNNWFSLYDESKGGEAEIAHTYDDAIAQAKELINKD